MSGEPTFGDPWCLALLALVPLLAWYRHRRRGYGALTYSRLPQGAGGPWRLHLAFYLRLLALALLIVVAARPQLGFAREQSLTEGIDVQLVLDVSESMAAEDFQPHNRLAVAKEVIRDFIAGRVGDRIGLVIFSGTALTKAPLTTDRRMLQLILDSVELYSLPGRTAIGLALANAAARLKESEAESKVIVLVTDGVNNQGAIDPDTATAVCESLGIKVYTVGVGTTGTVPVTRRYRDASGALRSRRVMIPVEVDEDLLRRIARRTGGRFFQATDARGLEATFAEIDELEKTELKVERWVRYQELFPPLAWGALGLLLLPLVPAVLRFSAEP